MVAEVLSLEKTSCDEVGIHYVETKIICDLHAEYFDDPSPTDCISFPIDQDIVTGYRLLGDVFVCTETAVLYAQQQQLDPYQETMLYVVHGLLHLLGYDDIEEGERAIMRKAEARHMDHLKSLHLSLGGEG